MVELNNVPSLLEVNNPQSKNRSKMDAFINTFRGILNKNVSHLLTSCIDKVLSINPSGVKTEYSGRGHQHHCCFGSLCRQGINSYDIDHEGSTVPFQEQGFQLTAI